MVASESQPKRKRVDSEIHESRERDRRDTRSEQRVVSNKRACYACGKEGHIVKDYPDQKGK